jgi:hypothetical protein
VEKRHERQRAREAQWTQEMTFDEKLAKLGPSAHRDGGRERGGAYQERGVGERWQLKAQETCAHLVRDRSGRVTREADSGDLLGVLEKIVKTGSPEASSHGGEGRQRGGKGVAGAQVGLVVGSGAVPRVRGQ